MSISAQRRGASFRARDLIRASRSSRRTASRAAARGSARSARARSCS
jgi:hypothetical protein